MEALILHFAVDQIVNVDGTVSSWVLMGVIVRLALRMGLHRDPSHWPSIRPLHAEMRRRLWISLYQMDFFTSVQVGLARIIKDAQCNALPPMHLANHDLDHDFEFAQMDDSGDSTTKPTPPLFIVQRNGIVKVAAAIYDATEEHPRLSQAALSSFEAQIDASSTALQEAMRQDISSSLAQVKMQWEDKAELSEYFDFSMFGYGDPNEPVIIDPFLIDPDIELDGTALKGYNP
ncbi:hypothetical protein SEUCBS139899_007943 [Sporothrix eucalyptigena]